jgi:ankyrin repeat protein
MALLKAESLNKYLPIHLACLYGAHVAVIEALVKACPQSVKVQDKDGNLPLHLACSRCSPEIVSVILANYQHACKICNNKEQIPLFLCVSRYDADHGIIDCLLDLYPEGATMKDSLGLTSLHLATMWRAPLAVLLSLIRENSEAVRIKDNLDRTPYLIARKLCRYDRKHAVTMALEGAMLRTNNVVLKAGSLLEIASFGMKHSSSTPRTIDGLKLRNMTYG